MICPAPVLLCLERLEQAGFAAYCVGGCVRDSLLGRIPQDYDLCTAATPEQIREVFAGFEQVRNGEKHGTVGIIVEHALYEITTFRKEGDYTDGRHPGWVQFVPDIEADLARRDFTVNAMAWSPMRGLQDPFSGAADLKNRVLRAVGDPQRRFREDALRILRGARFAAGYGLTLEPETEKAMFSLAPLLDQLARERVYSELCKLLMLADGQTILHFAPLITQVIPELAASVGFDQRNPHHQFDVYTHTAQVVAGVPPVLPLRWAALLHDVAKPAVFALDDAGRGHFLDHAPMGAAMADTALRRLKAPTALREQVVLLIEKHMLPLEPQRSVLRRRISQLGVENVQLLLQLQQADFCGKGVIGQTHCFAETQVLLQQLLQEEACLQLKDLAVNGHDLLALGYSGPAIGRILQMLLEQVVAEQLPNDRAALLQAIETL